MFNVECLMFKGDVDRCDAEGKGLKAGVLETRLGQMTQELLTPAERLDTLIEVGISGLVATDEASDERQDVREIQVVAPSDEFIRGVREL